jgi:hypothetical protein
MAKSGPKTRKYPRLLPVDLTEQEMKDTAHAMVEAQDKLQGAEEKKAEVSAQLGADVKAAKSEVSRLARLYRNGYEYRDVECEERHDPESNMVRVVRLDTFEVVEERPAPPQLSMSGVD